MTDQSVRGRYLWHELMSPDSAAARAFYAESVGWKTAPGEEDPSYSMFVAESGPVGGVADSAGAPTRWIAYIGTSDLDATVSEAQRLGGAVLKEQTAIPGGGRYAILADPQGAAFGVYASEREPAPEFAPRLGDFSWHELAATDWRAAWDFYSSLFAWDKIAEHDMGPMGVYMIFGRGDTQLGGMFDKRDSGLSGDAYWLGYISVENVHAAVEKVISAGGTVAMGPMEVPGGSWVAQCVDPAGALFAVQASPESMRAEKEVPEALETSEETVETVDSSPARSSASRGAAKKAGKKKARKKTGKKAGKKAAEKAAATTAKKAAKKAGGKKTSKKTAGKKAAKKTAKKAGKKVARKVAKKASGNGGKKTKKTSKKTSKKTAKKATRKTAKKVAGKTAKKAGKKAAKKTGKKTAKKTGKKRTAGTRSGRKTAARAGARGIAAGGKKRVSKKRVSKKRVSKKRVAKKGGSKKGIAKKGASKKRVSKKQAGKKTGGKKTSRKKNGGKKTGGRKKR